ncbi:MAG: hypothetical protein WCU88_13625 [Elusimicrobiota bacterium]|jgi:predicted transporter
MIDTPLHIRALRLRTMQLGPMGAVLAALTLFAAGLVMILLVFGKVLVLSAVVSWAWPHLFSTDFTRYVFGTEQLSFWKVLAVFTLAAFVIAWMRRRRSR